MFSWLKWLICTPSTKTLLAEIVHQFWDNVHLYVHDLVHYKWWVKTIDKIIDNLTLIQHHAMELGKPDFHVTWCKTFFFMFKITCHFNIIVVSYLVVELLWKLALGHLLHSSITYAPINMDVGGDLVVRVAAKAATASGNLMAGAGLSHQAKAKARATAATAANGSSAVWPTPPLSPTLCKTAFNAKDIAKMSLAAVQVLIKTSQHWEVALTKAQAAQALKSTVGHPPGATGMCQSGMGTVLP